MTTKNDQPTVRDLRSLWVMRVPVLSTAHMKRGTFEKLLSAEEEFRVINYEEGAFVRINPQDLSKLPPEIMRLAEWFTRAFPKQWWIRFDRDGDVIDGLPVYDW